LIQHSFHESLDVIKCPALRAEGLISPGLFMAGSPLIMHSVAMFRDCRFLVAVVVVLAVGAGSASAAECLQTPQARIMVQSGQIISTLKAVRAATAAVGGEPIDGRLCAAGGGYRYVVTILGSDGRVMRVYVDARSGAVLGTK
jgi:hypothetical protein